MPATFAATLVNMTLRKLGALTGLMAAAIAIMAMIAVGLYLLNATGRANVERYGSTITDQLAGLAASRVATQDHVTLNLMATHIADDPAIVNASIFTRDNRLISTGGRVSVDATRTSPAENIFKHDIIFEGQNYGYVRVVVDADALAPSLGGWLWGAGLLSGLLAIWCASLLGGRVERHLAAIATQLEDFSFYEAQDGAAMPRLQRVSEHLLPTDEALANDGPSPNGPPPYLVVLNLFNLLSLPTAEREPVLVRCAQRVELVCERYNGRVARLPGTGLFVLLDAQENQDHAFLAICATLLAIRLMTDLNEERSAGLHTPLSIRAGVLHLNEHPQSDTAEALRLELETALSDGILLSATARNDALLVDRAVFRSLVETPRLQFVALRTPITTSDQDGDFHYQITGVDAATEVLLARQFATLLEDER